MELTKCCSILTMFGCIFVSFINRSVVDVGDDPGEMDVDDDGDIEEKPDVEFVFVLDSSFFFAINNCCSFGIKS